MRKEFDGHKLSSLAPSDQHTPVAGRKRSLQSPDSEQRSKSRKMDSQNGSSSRLHREFSKVRSVRENDDDCDSDSAQKTPRSMKRGQGKWNGSGRRSVNGHGSQRGVPSRVRNGVMDSRTPVVSSMDAAMSPVIPLQNCTLKIATPRSGRSI